jgi:hypothetical protein
MRTLGSYEFNRLKMRSPTQRLAIIAQMRAQGIYVPPAFDGKGLLRSRAGVAASEFTPNGITHTSSVALGRDNIFVVRKTLGYPDPQFSLVAVSRQDGKEQWRITEMQPGSAEPFCSSPLVTRSLVVAAMGGGRIMAADAATGALQWSDTLQGDIVSSPALAEGTLVVATMSGNVYAYATTPAARPVLAKPLIKSSSQGGMRLQFGLEERSHVFIQLVSANGRVARVLSDGIMLPGNHSISVTAPNGRSRGIASGSYVIRLRIGRNSSFIHVPLVK